MKKVIKFIKEIEWFNVFITIFLLSALGATVMCIKGCMDVGDYVQEHGLKSVVEDFKEVGSDIWEGEQGE